MTDPTEVVETVREEVGVLDLEWEPLPGDKIRLQAEYNDDILENADYSKKIFSEGSIRGQFLNSVEESLADRNGVDPQETRRELKEWFAEMNQALREEETAFLPPEARHIVDGTRSVEVHGGETTVWKVTLKYAGYTRELEFTAGEMVSGSGAALKEKIANQFYDVIDIEEADWETIRDRWQEEKTVVSVVEETGSDAVASRVLEYLANSLIAVADREDMGNDVAAVWYDETNETGYGNADPDDAIAWVQDSFLIDQLESAGKKADYKPTLVRDLISRGDLFGGNLRKMWAWDTRTRVYPFQPEAIGVTPDDVGETDDPAHSEVSA